MADAKIDIPSTAVKTLLVIVDRTWAVDFEIINQGQLLHSGSEALKLNELNLRISNGETNALFTTEQVQQIARVIRTGAVSDRRRYKDNVTFNLTSDDLEKINKKKVKIKNQLLVEANSEKKQLSWVNSPPTSHVFYLSHFSPTPEKPLKIEKTGEKRLKKVKGKKAKTGTPRVEAAKEPATPHGIR